MRQRKTFLVSYKQNIFTSSNIYIQQETTVIFILFLFSKETKTCLTKTLFNDDAADNETTRLWKNVRHFHEGKVTITILAPDKICWKYFFSFLTFSALFRHLFRRQKKLNSALGLFSLFSRPTLLHEYCTPTGIGGLTCAQVFLVRNGAKIVLCLFTVFSSVFSMIYKSIFVFFRVVLYREIGRWPKRLGSNVSYTRDRIQPYSGAKFQTKTCFFEIINYFHGLYWI